jgi:hypothetical protein
MPNWSQVSGVIERVVMAGVMFGVGKGWIASDDAVNMTGMIVGISAAVYAYWVNRPKNLIKQAASVDGTVVVTKPEIAYNTTNTNIVSNTTNKVQMK